MEYADLEGYVFGLRPVSVVPMPLRTAESHAGFFVRELNAGMSLLDVGCGPGTITIGLAQAVHPRVDVGVELFGTPH